MEEPTFRLGQWIYAGWDKEDAIKHAESMGLTPDDVRLVRSGEQIALIMKKDVYIKI